MNTQAIEIPSRFTYYKNLDCSDGKFFKTAFKYTFGVTNSEMPEEKVQLHKENLLKSDTVADDLVSDAFGSMEPGQARKLFDQASEKGLESITEPLPDSFIKFFKEAETDPEWLDKDKLNLGVATCQRLGKLATYSLSMSALLQGYTNSDLAKPLIFTNGLAGDSTYNRVTFTSAFWIAVTETGALERGAEGYKTALFVRLKHGLVRRQILKNPDWKTDLWGIPINTSDSAITNVGFSSVMMLGAKILGMRISKEEEDAVLHFWRYIGYLIGDNDDLLPKNIEEAAQTLFFVGVSNDHKPDQDVLTLSHSFLESTKQKGCGLKWEIQGFFKYWFYRTMSQYLVPYFNHKRLNLPSSYGLFLLVPLVSWPIMFVSETIRRTFPSLKPAFQRYGRWRHVRWLRQRFTIASTRPSFTGSIEDYVK